MPSPGLEISVHLVPFQCAARVRALTTSLENPTAQASLADNAVTPVREPLRPARSRFGVSTRCHLVPFQRAIRAWEVVPVVIDMPTAQALDDDAADTAERLLALVR